MQSIIPIVLLLAIGLIEGRSGQRQERAAEIPSTSPNHQAIVSSAAATSDLVTAAWPALTSEASNGTEAPTPATTSPSSTEGTAMTSIGESLVDEVSSIPTTTTTSTTTEVTTTTTTVTTTTTKETTVAGGNSAEYFADDHAVVEEDKSVGQLSNGSSTERAMGDSTTRVPIASEFASRASAAVGRVLSQEENVPWPEAKSTKVIGTIIEDIGSPLQSERQESITVATLTGSAIAAIVLCAFLLVVTTAGASGYWWYRRRYSNRPETLNDRYAASEAGGNGDDIFRVGYIHSPEMPRDSSEEMYSLDNDSFLTSLEAMTIPTYWTETIKHTKL